MINTQAAGMPQDRGNHLAKWSVRGGGEAIGPPWRLIPRLALLVERIWRAANRDVLCLTVLQAPGIHATRTHANRQIMHHPKRHAGP